MPITITEVNKPESLNAENSRIDVNINHPQHGWIPYTLDIDDTEGAIDNAALLTLIGDDFRPYLPPEQWELDEAAEVQARSHRQMLLTTYVDPIVSNPLLWGEMDEYAQEVIVTYRQSLLDITTQENFPHDIEWPMEPM